MSPQTTSIQLANNNKKNDPSFRICTRPIVSNEVMSCRGIIVIGIDSFRENWSTPQSDGDKGKPIGSSWKATCLSSWILILYQSHKNLSVLM